MTYMNGLEPCEIDCHGDSITAFGWPEKLGMVNRGVGGAGWWKSINTTIPTIGARIKADYAAGRRPKGIVALGGTNDMISVDLNTITNVYWAQIEIAEWCAARDINIWFATQTPYGNPAAPGATGTLSWLPTIDTRRLAYIQWMRAQWGPQLRIADVEGWLRDGNQWAVETYVVPDRSHLTEAGKTRLSEAMHGVLLDRVP